MSDEVKEEFFKSHMRRLYNRNEEISSDDKDFKKMNQMKKSLDAMTIFKWSMHVLIEKFNEDTNVQ